MLAGRGNNLVIDPATVADAERFAADAPWARAGEWRVGGSSLVAKNNGEPAGIVGSATNRIHPTRDPVLVFITEPFRRHGIGSALVNSIKTRRSMPLLVKAHPGTPTHEFYTSLGAVRYQVCPPERIDTSSIGVRRWALENRRDDIRTGDRLRLDQLTEAWTTMYEVVHASWAPPGCALAFSPNVDP